MQTSMVVKASCSIAQGIKETSYTRLSADKTSMNYIPTPKRITEDPLRKKIAESCDRMMASSWQRFKDNA